MRTRIAAVSTCCVMAVCGCGSSDSKNTGLNLQNLDTTVRAQDDFYEYACGGWMKANPLKPEFARYGIYDQLRENSLSQVQGLVQTMSKAQNADGTKEQKIGDMYALAMDSARLNEDGSAPIKRELEAIAAIDSRTALAAKIMELHTQQVAPFFGLSARADYGNSTQCIAWLSQGGLGLGDREYYLQDDARSKEIRTKYVEHIAKMLRIADYARISGAVDVRKVADEIMLLETTLAAASMDKHTRRNPANIYNKISVEELLKVAPNFDWQRFFEVSQIGETKELNLSQPAYMAEFSKIVKDYDLNVLKNYLAWCYVRSAADYLSDEFVNQNFQFYGKVLSGKEELRPRWKRAVDAVNSTLGEAVGEAYAAKYFPPEAKQRMKELVDNLQLAFVDRINALDWMSDTTKNKALEKLSTFTVKIGYPDKWRDYSNFSVTKNASYWDNILASNRFEYAYRMNKINKPVDKSEWNMFPQTVNAYYNSTNNEICFPAAILQPPFFNMAADDAVNYGAIGAVIGHEITHGFDDRGRKFDKDGNMKDWWTARDNAQFVERAQVLVEHFNGIKVLPNLNADGKYTLGENIADFGGLQMAFSALQKALNGAEPAPIDGFTAAQRFFLAFATIWASNVRDQEKERLTKTDVHSLARWRVNGTLPHIPTFVEAFNVQSSDGMYLAPEKRARIW